MGLNVKQLISKLKKLPQNLPVYWADHDHDTYETNNEANRVHVIDPLEMNDIQREWRTPGNPDERYVVIRP